MSRPALLNRPNLGKARMKMRLLPAPLAAALLAAHASASAERESPEAIARVCV